MKNLIIVRGGGDLATGVVHRLWSAGFPVLVLETAAPAAIRRQVCVCEAIYTGSAQIEGMRAVRIDAPREAEEAIASGLVPVLTDPQGRCIREMKPMAVIDATLAKRNTGMRRDMAPLTAALGPGFVAGRDVDAVIETMRGHNLGRIIRQGTALPDTGVPGMIGGYAAERVMHAQHDGTLRAVCAIGSFVQRGETIAVIKNERGEHPVPASITGLLRGLIRDGYPVKKGLKIADIDPRREEYENCFTISDKARCIAGSVLELVCRCAMEAQRG